MIFPCATLALALSGPLRLADARARAASSGRTALVEALRDRPAAAPIELAALVAAEERPLESANTILAEIEAQLDGLADAARARLRLSGMVGADTSEPETVATAVLTVLFGSSAPDDANEAFFKGNAADYYDPQNSFLDCVLRRRQGIPITLSLVYLGTCRRLGLEMVGLNAPAHLLLAPADAEAPFVVDAFQGAILSTDDAAALVARNAGFGAGGDRRGALLLRALRSRPMSARMWCARMLRNLRALHARADDVGRTLGASERLRLVGAAEPGASTPLEQADCAVQLAYCVYALRWEERRGEAAALLAALARDERIPPEDKPQLEALLADPWFADAA